MTAIRYGLRYALSGDHILLWQISGDGRMAFRRGDRVRWGQPPCSAVWEVYEATMGFTFSSKDEAAKVSDRLAGTMQA